MFDPDIPHNHLPAIPSAEVLETRRVLKRAIEVSRSLAEMLGISPQIPSTFGIHRSILLQEARASSQIENVVTTNDALYRAVSGNPDQADAQTKEVLRYNDALALGYEDWLADRPLRPSLLIQIARTIKGSEIGVRDTPGCRIVNDRTGETVYTPPEGKDRILTLLNDLCGYLHDTSDPTDPLIKMIAAHYQFEAIHPFPDGNGRTGRVLNILSLLHCGLLDAGFPALYLSRRILQEKSRYYELLRRVTAERSSEAWETWILFMLDVTANSVADTLSIFYRVEEALSTGMNKARVEMRKGYSKELIELIFTQPYTRINMLEERGIARRVTASVYLRELERIGLLRSVRAGRDVLYFNPALMEALSLGQ